MKHLNKDTGLYKKKIAAILDRGNPFIIP